MTDYALNNILQESDLVEFDLYTVKDQQAVNEPITLKNLEASEQALNYALRQTPWFPQAHETDQGLRIGYNTNNTEVLGGLGLTEERAYSLWIDSFKSNERRFKSLVGVETLTQTQYDALLCLDFLTGDFKFTGSTNRQFRIYEHIQSGNWNYIASALVLSGNNRPQRQRESAILMLADYGQPIPRETMRSRGIQNMRSLYPSGLLDDRSRRQTELVYYIETQRFLPGLSQSRKTQIVEQQNRY